MSLLPQLHRHAWMDEEIDAFREQARRYIARTGKRCWKAPMCVSRQC